MLKYYIFMLFPVIICGNSMCSTDNINQQYLYNHSDYTKSKNYVLKSKIFPQSNSSTTNNHNYTIADFYDIKQVCKGENQQLKNNISNLNKELLTVKDKLSNKEISLKLQNKIMGELNDKLAQNNKYIQNLNEENNNLKSEIQSKNTEIENMNIIINNLRHELMRKDRKIDALKEVKKELKNTISEKDSKIEDIENELTKQNRRNRHLLKRTQYKQLDIKSLKHELKSKDRKIELLKESKEELKNKILDKNSQIEDIQQELLKVNKYNERLKYMLVKNKELNNELLQKQKDNYKCSIQ